MPAQLVTMAQAKAQLKITTPDGDPGDADLLMKLEQAEAIILNRINAAPYWRPITATWTAATVPRDAHAAILRELVELSRFRGDDPANVGPDSTKDGELTTLIRMLLVRYCDQVIA